MYKIAVASSDGINVDSSFGGSSFFYIYEIEKGSISNVSRLYIDHEENDHQREDKREARGCASKRCGQGSNGCQGKEALRLLDGFNDVTCIIVNKAGPKIKDAFALKAISVLETDIDVKTAVDKAIIYFEKTKNRRE